MNELAVDVNLISLFPPTVPLCRRCRLNLLYFCRPRQIPRLTGNQLKDHLSNYCLVTRAQHINHHRQELTAAMKKLA